MFRHSVRGTNIVIFDWANRRQPIIGRNEVISAGHLPRGRRPFPERDHHEQIGSINPDASGLLRLVALRTRNTLHACPPHASGRPVVRFPSGLGAHPPSEPPLVPALRARIPDAVPWRCPAPPSETDARSSLPTLTDTLHEPLPLSESWRKGGLAARFANGRDAVPDAAQIHRAKMAAVVSGAGLPLTGKGSCITA